MGTGDLNVRLGQNLFRHRQTLRRSQEPTLIDLALHSLAFQTAGLLAP
jgi:hypothetical protein